MSLNDVLEEESNEFRKKIILSSDILEDFASEISKKGCLKLIDKIDRIFKENYILFSNNDIQYTIMNELFSSIKNKCENIIVSKTEEDLAICRKINKEMVDIINDSNINKESKESMIREKVNKYEDQLYESNDYNKNKINFSQEYENIQSFISQRFKLYDFGDANYEFKKSILNSQNDLEENLKDRVNSFTDKNIDKLHEMGESLKKELYKEDEISQNIDIVENNKINLVDVAINKVNKKSKFKEVDLYNNSKDVIRNNFKDIFSGLELSDNDIKIVSELLYDKLINKCGDYEDSILKELFKMDSTILSAVKDAYGPDNLLSDQDYEQIKEVYSSSQNDIDNNFSLIDSYNDFKINVKNNYNIDLEKEEFSKLDGLIKSSINNTEINLKDIINGYIKENKIEGLQAIETVNNSIKDILVLNRELDSSQLGELLESNKSDETIISNDEYVSAFK